jgi:hypothetical protein
MPNIFHPAMNTVSRVSIFGALFLVVAVIALMWFLVRTPYATEVNVIREQPIPFSHQHHVSDVGMDCRYCHFSAETSSFAGIPPTSVCMNCHAWLFNDQEILSPVRESYREEVPIEWTRVHDLADFAYFNHRIHLHKGIACVTCHGNVAEMPLMWRENSLLMEWCLQCHRNPIPNVRPREFVYRTESLAELTESQDFREFIRRSYPELDSENVDLGKLQQMLGRDYGIKSQTNCSNCHW